MSLRKWLTWEKNSFLIFLNENRYKLINVQKKIAIELVVSSFCSQFITLDSIRKTKKLVNFTLIQVSK